MLTHQNKRDYEIDIEELESVDDIIVHILKKGPRPDLGGLSKREYLYVALASNSRALLEAAQITMLQAFQLIGPTAREHMFKKWSYVPHYDFILT